MNKDAVNIGYWDFLKSGIIVAIHILAAIIIITTTAEISLIVLSSYIYLLVFMIIALIYSGKFALILLISSLIPLLVISNFLHYQLLVIVVQNFALYIFFLVAFFFYLGNSKIELNLTNYLNLPVFLILIYTSIQLTIGIVNSRDTSKIFFEFYNYFYYSFVIILPILLKQEQDFRLLIKAILIIFTILAVEHSILFLTFDDRFVSFQSNFFVFILSFFLAIRFYFHVAKLKKLMIRILIVLILFGIFSTLTRGIWVSALVTIIMTYLIYLKVEKGWQVKKMIPFVLILLLPLIVLQDKATVENQQSSEDYYNVSYRTKSIVNPTEDTSFLMRVEAGYYTINKFLDQPLFGQGFGDYYKYIIFDRSTLPHYYLDNSWIYFLWKGGLIGFFLMVFLYFRFFKASLFVLEFTKDRFVKLVSLATLASLVGVMVLSLLTAVLIKYKLNLIFAMLMAYINVHFNRLNSLQRVDSNQNSKNEK